MDALINTITGEKNIYMCVCVCVCVCVLCVCVCVCVFKDHITVQSAFFFEKNCHVIGKGNYV